MNILPKKYSQFKQKEYWDSFFKKLRDQNKNFEWYGNLQPYRNPFFFLLNSLYNRNGKNKSISVAHLGCGNSQLADELVSTYPIFDFSISNLDYSESVINEMRIKSKDKHKGAKIIYDVCDLLKPIPEQLSDRFEIVLDKGTLDAILPQDKSVNIKQIKEIYFKNVQRMLKRNRYGSYVVISMLQEFVLRTLLQNFKDNPHFKINITECAIPDSQLQPFLVQVVYSPEPYVSRSITLTLLSKAIINFQSVEEVIHKVSEIQRMTVFTESIRVLRANQLVKFNLFAVGSHRIKYMLDIADHNQESILSKNTCAVFIAPLGMEVQFSGESAIRQILYQIGTSRVIVVKLVIGESCKSVQEVKDDLNPVLHNLIQKGCNIAQVPYLTDGSFSQRQYVFRDEQIFIEEVMQGGECYRRLLLKNAPSLVQSQFKLAYFSKKNHNVSKDVVSLSLPVKKGMVTGIDIDYLDEGYCRSIVSGLSYFLRIEEGKGLHLGGGGCTISKFLYHKCSNLFQTIVQQSKSVILNGSKFFEWPTDEKFKLVNADALAYVYNLTEEVKFDFIIIDVSNNEEKDQNYPPLQFSGENYIEKCLSFLNEGGLIIYNTIRLQQSESPLSYDKILSSFKEITEVYRSEPSSENVVYFGLKGIKAKIQYKQSFAKGWEWRKEQIQKIKLVYQTNKQ